MSAKDATVVDLESNATWHARQRYSRELNEAMRRHPSYLAATADTRRRPVDNVIVCRFGKR